VAATTVATWALGPAATGAAGVVRGGSGSAIETSCRPAAGVGPPERLGNVTAGLSLAPGRVGSIADGGATDAQATSARRTGGAAVVGAARGSAALDGSGGGAADASAGLAACSS